MKRSSLRGLILIFIAVGIVAASGRWFLQAHHELEVYPSPHITEIKYLSDYSPDLKGTAGDTRVFIYDSGVAGGTLLVVGGVHGDEAAGTLAALLFAENAQMEAGKLIVIPYANASGFTHNLPQEAHPAYYRLETPAGERLIKYGARLTNPIHQWPDPTIYVEQVAGQKLAGTEARNLNRAYPGSPNGNLTSLIAFGLVELIKREEVDVAIDMHESSPEYPVVNALVAHERGLEVAILASFDLADQGIDVSIEPSPINFRGLSHREWGDSADTLAFLLEYPNPAQGRLRGKTNEELIVTGKDSMYVRAAKRDRLYIPYDERGISVSERAAKHVASVMALADVYSTFNPKRRIVIAGMASYEEIVAKGAGAFLAPSQNN